MPDLHTYDLNEFLNKLKRQRTLLVRSFPALHHYLAQPLDAVGEPFFSRGEAPAHEAFALGPERRSRSKAEAGLAHQHLAEFQTVSDAIHLEKHVHGAAGNRRADAVDGVEFSD